MLCIWWDVNGVLYYELLQTSETVNTDCYKLLLQRLNENINLKRPFKGNDRRPVKLLNDNSRSDIARSVKNKLVSLDWEVMQHPADSPYIAPSDYYLFRSMHASFTDVNFETLYMYYILCILCTPNIATQKSYTQIHIL